MVNCHGVPYEYMDRICIKQIDNDNIFNYRYYFHLTIPVIHLLRDWFNSSGVWLLRLPIVALGSTIYRLIMGI